MEKITAAGTQLDGLKAIEARDIREQADLRPLADYELFLVGGGDDGPGWTPPK